MNDILDAMHETNYKDFASRDGKWGSVNETAVLWNGFVKDLIDNVPDFTDPTNLFIDDIVNVVDCSTILGYDRLAFLIKKSSET